jgi:hypothetical protein
MVAMIDKDPVEEAVNYWNDGNSSMFEFCIQASFIVGRNVEGETKRLAKRIRRSVDTVERYAKGGLLWHAILQKYPADSELIREALDWQFWVALGVIWKKDVVSLAGAKHWLDEAMTNGWEYEKFYSMLPQKKALDSEWQKTAVRAATILDDLCNSPAFGVDEVLFKTGVRIFRLASSLLKGMSMKNIIDLLIAEKIADNQFRAAAIANGCKLYELKDDDAKMKRARLYRDWRVSQYFPKHDTKSCFEKAIAGEAAPTPLLVEAAHSEATEC